ncbi:MAG TPA: DNA methyltransferase [Bacteroidales bacterium]|nr:DNA methyltransferase [Bacteroidales bacterium]
MLKDYLRSVQDSMNQGDAREESYYTHLDRLIREFAVGNGIKNVDITILPKKTEAGNPDFRVWDGKNRITGYIEAKDPSVANLDRVEKSEQLERYKNTFPNVILTNFYEFRLYRDGVLIKKAMIGRQVIAKRLKTAPPVENEEALKDLLNSFFSFSLPHVRNAKTLAVELAKRTRFLRDEVISIEIAEEENQPRKPLLGFYQAFKKYLIGTLTQKSFADLYSQTLTYGLFASRTRSDNSFNRELAFKYIPNTIGILRDVFRFISLEDPPKPLQIIVDDIAEVLSVTDVNKILQDYYQEGKGNDPIIHFYETFLTAYDPSIREKRGVYYTPEPVVGYIVRSIHQILKTHFDISDGLAGEKVTLLDPAGGTLTFPAAAIKLAVKEFVEKYGEGGKTKFIKQQVLSNFYAFELIMAPYAIGHLKISFLFEELGYRLTDDERFKLYLTNTLEMEDLEQIHIPGLSSLSQESHLAGRVKKTQPVLVIFGNPPYSGHSANQNAWTERLLKERIDGCQSYYEVDGKPLGEKNPKWLQDDYVKFLRFAQWKIHKAGAGIVSMITNHSYLDNPTFRGMRQSLITTFNEIYILDLHGNSLKKETCPDGGKDENVFDIRQGTAIAIFVKRKDAIACKVYHGDIFGVREAKYGWLDSNDFTPQNYQLIQPEEPYYFLTQRKTDSIMGYLKWPSIGDVFPVNSVGVVTSRDEFVIDCDRKKLENRLRQLTIKGQKDEIIAEAYNLKDTQNWKLTDARIELQKIDDVNEQIIEVLYRPFDKRYLIYNELLVERTRRDVMRHMLNENLGLITVRQVAEGVFNHCLTTKNIIESRITLSNKGIAYLFPLYLYSVPLTRKVQFQSMILFEPEAPYSSQGRTPNIDKTIYETLNKTYNRNLSPEEILYYIYGVFYSKVYREKYAEFLKIDFPRVPFTKDYTVFKTISAYGLQLSDLHLLKSATLAQPISKYQGDTANDRIEKIEYKEQERRIYINEQKFFDNVASGIWNYHIGGYQVLQKYLKDRKGRTMDDPRHYCRMITALSLTIDIQKQIDAIYPNVEKELIVL